MAPSLKEQCDACREAILRAIIDSLQERTDYIAQIERTPRGDVPVSGIALELFPWHARMGLSLRLTSDFPLGTSRYGSANWPHFDFTVGCHAPSIVTAISLVTQIYDRGNEPGIDRRDMAHLAFMAGAEALLHPQVSRLLNDFGINAPTLTDTIVTSPFQYIVIDADQTVKSNYCDIVMANRVALRIIGNAASQIVGREPR